MKIIIKAEKTHFRFLIPNSLILSPLAVRISNAIRKQNSYSNYPYIDPSAVAVLRSEIKQLKKHHSPLNIVEVITHTGEYISITL